MSHIPVGTTIAGRYRVERAIGEGGHGVVYRALDVNVGRPVALKVLHRALSGEPDIAERFEREAMLARELSHPNTVRLHDYGRDTNGVLFIAYELLEGQPLDAVLTGAPLTGERVARIGKQILKSLMEAHERGIVHRDIKPSNVFLCNYSGEKDFVKVLDFGIAKAAGAKALTQAGYAIGTPNYMAPEQLRGAEVSPATDVFAVGLLLAQALSGTVVVPGATLQEIAATTLSPEPIRLPPAALQSPLGPVILRAVHKPAERRYPSARHMLDDLDAIAVVSSGPISASDRLSFGMAPTGGVASAPAPMVPVRLKSKGGSAIGWLTLAAVVVVLGGAAGRARARCPTVCEVSARAGRAVTPVARPARVWARIFSVIRAARREASVATAASASGTFASVRPGICPGLGLAKGSV